MQSTCTKCIGLNDFISVPSMVQGACKSADFCERGAGVICKDCHLQIALLDRPAAYFEANC